MVKNNLFKIPNSPYSLIVDNLGEFRMEAEHGKIKILDRDKNIVIDFKENSFYLHHKPNSLEYYFPSCSSNIVCLDWLFFYVHANIVPLLINISDKTYLIVEPKRNIDVNSISEAENSFLLKCQETTWKGSDSIIIDTCIKILKIKFKPLTEFFKLNPRDIGVSIIFHDNGRSVYLKETNDPNIFFTDHIVTFDNKKLYRNLLEKIKQVLVINDRIIVLLDRIEYNILCISKTGKILWAAEPTKPDNSDPYNLIIIKNEKLSAITSINNVNINITNGKIID